MYLSSIETAIDLQSIPFNHEFKNISIYFTSFVKSQQPTWCNTIQANRVNT